MDLWVGLLFRHSPYKYVDPDGHSPIDVVFLAVDIGKLGVALYTGVGVQAAVVDVAMSVVGVASPIPGAGQALKAVVAIDKAVDVVKAADNAADVAKSTDKVGDAASGLKTYQTYAKTNEKRERYIQEGQVAKELQIKMWQTEIQIIIKLLMVLVPLFLTNHRKALQLYEGESSK